MRILRNLSMGLFCILGLSPTALAQTVSFVDGYHGGIYGHYPLWNTQFYVDKLTQHPNWKINLEIEPETWDTVKVRTPEAYQVFKRIAASSRIEFVNPSYAQPYMYNISGESIIRQFEYGIKKYHAHFPDVVFTTYSVEEPCFTSCLPQILKQFGFKHAVLKCPNTCWGGYTRAYGGERINWKGPDGTSITTVPRYACEALEKKSVWQTTAWGNSTEYLEACSVAGIKSPIGMCLQDAGWRNGPWIGSGQKVKNGSVYRTWKEYFEEVPHPALTDTWEFCQEDVQVSLMWGSQVLQKLAREVRTAENSIVMAEKINTMNILQGGKGAPQQLLDEAWRTLFLSQHHDSWIVPYNRLHQNKTWAQTISLWTNQTHRISSDIIRTSFDNSRDSVPTGIRIINTTSTAREERVTAELPLSFSWRSIVLTDAYGKEVPYHVIANEGKAFFCFEAKIPAFGYSCYSLTEGKKSSGSKASVCDAFYDKNNNYVMESDVYKITLDINKGGSILSLIDKQLGNKEFVDRQSSFRFNELRGYFYDEQTYHSTAEYPAEVSVIEKTPSCISIRIKNRIAGSVAYQTITLCQGEKRIDCSLQIDWKGNPGIGEYRSGNVFASNHRPSYDDRYKLLLVFPAALNQSRVYKNAPFDVCESKLENTFFNSWDNIKHNIVLNWVDFLQQDQSYGFALLTDHTTSYTHGADFPPGLTVQYSGQGLWGVDYPINGPTFIRYALLPHSGKWDKSHLWTESIRWNEPLIVQSHYSSPAEMNKSFIRMDKPGYEITSTVVKGSDIYIRLFNAEADDKPVKIAFGFIPKKAELVQLSGETTSMLTLKKERGESTTEISLPRFGLTTIKTSM